MRKNSHLIIIHQVTITTDYYFSFVSIGSLTIKSRMGAQKESTILARQEAVKANGISEQSKIECVRQDRWEAGDGLTGWDGGEDRLWLQIG